MELLSIDRLSVDLGVFKIKNISLDIDKGCYLCIIGPTGVGKTVLLETIAGFHKPKNGRIILDGKDITNLPPEKRNISIVYQDYMLFPHINVYDNIAYGLRKKLKDKHIIREEVLKVSKILGIEHLLNRKPLTLSGGEQQRVAIARAILVKPKLLLMDEPFNALDTRTAEVLRTFVKRVVKEYNLTVIHVTHDMTDVWSLASKVAIMNQGNIIQFGEIEEVFSQPINKFVADFVDINVINGKPISIKNGYLLVNVSGTLLRAPAHNNIGNKVRIFIRPEDLFLSKSPIKDAYNVFEAKITEITERGPLAYIYLSYKNTFLKALVTRGQMKISGLSPGNKVYVTIKPSSIKVV